VAVQGGRIAPIVMIVLMTTIANQKAAKSVAEPARSDHSRFANREKKIHQRKQQNQKVAPEAAEAAATMMVGVIDAWQTMICNG